MLALRIPTDGSEVHLVSVDIKDRPQDDGSADFFDDVADLSPWLGDAFKYRRVADFYVKNVEDLSAQFPRLVRDDDTALHGRYLLYYTILPTLPVNKCCANYIGFDPPADRLFWRGDLFVVRYEGELGMGHEYVDVPLTLTRIIKDIIRSAYQRRALESIVEDDAEFERIMQRDRERRPWFHAAVETGALERFRTGQPLSDGDILLLRQMSGTVQWPNGDSESLPPAT
ncbi:hypothetical protein AYO20_02647 [Fonsecaea nubica]|uniref:Uncharacterized protein n=1 Tax=Fonsecaea nubica TaxID=856822 RepID=A0A178DAQ8_9EURO|nr:hypothetical protein AYO20_02647 [Fonsecaea nubica]OAL38195.1 hypothetical protein AYO20_02647 [Fonsecaea nubica]